MGNCHIIPSEATRSATLTLILLLLLAVNLDARDYPPSQKGNAAFHQDLRFLSAFTMLPMERTGGGTSTLILQQSLAAGVTDTQGFQTGFQYAIQPSQDYGLRFRLSTWPQGSGAPVNGTGVGMHYFAQRPGKNQYALSLMWHQLRSAGQFRHRDVGVIGSFDREIADWTIRGYSGISLFNTWINNSLGFDNQRDTQIYAGVAVERLLGERFVVSLSFPVQRDGFGVSLRLGGVINHLLDDPEQSDE